MVRLGVPTPPSASLVMTLLIASLSGAPAWAQTEPPPVGAAVPEAAPAAPPPAEAAPAPAPSVAPLPAAAAPPSLEAPAPAPVIDPGALPPLPPPEERPPIYKQTWFWAVIAVVGVTAAMITYGLATQGPATPSTDFGNMRAF